MGHYITVLCFTSIYNSFSTYHATGKQTLLGILILELVDLIIQNYSLCFTPETFNSFKVFSLRQVTGKERWKCTCGIAYDYHKKTKENKTVNFKAINL